MKYRSDLTKNEILNLIVDTIRNCYTYTFESILHTLDKSGGWFRFAVIY